MGLPQQIFLGHGFTRHARSSDGINPHLRRAIRLDQLFLWVQGHKETHYIGSFFHSIAIAGLFTKMCSDVFGEKLTPELLERGIEVFPIS